MKTDNLEKFVALLDEQPARLTAISDEVMLKTMGPGLWSGKELLGHLSDAAAINRQRIVRSQYEAMYEFPYYDQPLWVRIQAYGTYQWADLVSMYLTEYRHLRHILESLPQESQSDRCPVKFSSSDYVTLDWLVGHMTRHNEFHLNQIYWLAGQGEMPDDRKLSQAIEALP